MLKQAVNLVTGTKVEDTGEILPHAIGTIHGAINGTIGNISRRALRTIQSPIESIREVGAQSLAPIKNLLKLQPIEAIKNGVLIPTTIIKETKGLIAKTMGGTVDALAELGTGAADTWDNANLTVRNTVKNTTGALLGDTAKKIVGLPVDFATYTLASQAGRYAIRGVEKVSDGIDSSNRLTDRAIDSITNGTFKAVSTVAKSPFWAAKKISRAVSSLVKEMIPEPAAEPVAAAA